MEDPQRKPHLHGPAAYAIQVQGHLAPGWARHFPELQIENGLDPDGQPVAVLHVRLPDQAALMGILTRLHGLGLTLRRVERLAPDQPAGSVPAQGTRSRA